jgi:hypothetical protein
MAATVALFGLDNLKRERLSAPALQWKSAAGLGIHPARPLGACCNHRPDHFSNNQGARTAAAKAPTS